MQLAEKPIPFTAPMVRAVRAGQKTQTRRLPKVQPALQFIHDGDFPAQVKEGSLFLPEHTGKWIWPTTDGEFFGFSPYRVGQVLWTREAWRASSAHDSLAPRDIPQGDGIAYAADGEHRTLLGKLRPGMFMMRWMSRDLLRVTHVRVQRLQDISEADAIAEGIRWRDTIVETRYEAGGHVEVHADRYFFDGGDDEGYESAVDAYLDLWETINGPGSADLNPFVWAYTFERVTA